MGTVIRKHDEGHASLDHVIGFAFGFVTVRPEIAVSCQHDDHFVEQIVIGTVKAETRTSQRASQRYIF